MKPKIIVTSSTFPRWKGDTIPPFVYELSTRLSKHYDVHVLAPHSQGALLNEYMDGLHVHRYRYFLEKYEKLTEMAILPSLKKKPYLIILVFFLFFTQFLALINLVCKEKVSVIHAHWIIPQGIIAVIYKKIINHKIKVILTSHGSDILGLKGWPFSGLIKWIINNSDGMTAVSNAIKAEVLSLGIRKDLPLNVIPMGVDFTTFSPQKYNGNIIKLYDINGPFILSVGRTSEKKGMEYLLYAMPSVLDSFPNAKLIIVGDGEKLSDLKMISQELGLLNSSVKFVGALKKDELPQYYASADVFISPSLSEGFGLVLVEAIACGTPTIGTKLPAVFDIIKDGETGFLVDTESPDQIAHKIIYVLKHKEEVKYALRNARDELLSKFDWDHLAALYANFITTTAMD
jgi:glycosyltransferase involved in cell wall biosynthesis